MPDANPPLRAELVWAGGLRFDATSGGTSLVLDGKSEVGPSPMQAMAMGVAGCMAIDVASILEKGRHGLKGLRVSMEATRATDHPKRFTHIVLRFLVRGDVPQHAVERAVALSRDTYCSALNSLRSDVHFETQISIEP